MTTVPAIFQQAFWYSWADRLHATSASFLVVSALVLWLLNVLVLALVLTDGLASDGIEEWLMLRGVFALMTAVIVVQGLRDIAHIETDMRVIAASSATPGIDTLVMSPALCWRVFLVGALAGLGLGMSIDGPARFYVNLVSTSIIPSTCLVLVIGPMAAFQLTALWRYCGWLQKAAKTITVRLLDPEALESFTSPVLRASVAAVVGLSFGPAVIIVSERHTPIGMLFILLAVLYTLAWIVPLTRPVLTLRRRIAAVREQELANVRRFLRGDISNLDGTQLALSGQSPGLTDALLYEERLQDMWDTPIAPRYHRLMLFGLLPPATWVMAAVVENLIY